MKFRKANREDFKRLPSMVRSYLNEVYEVGGDIVPSDRSVRALCEWMLAVVEGDITGVVLVGDENSVWSAAAEIPFFWEPRFGRTAFSIGTYVGPSLRGKGVSKKIREDLFGLLREQGFDAIVGGVHLGNEAGEKSAKSVGFTPYQVMGFLDLGGEK